MAPDFTSSALGPENPSAISPENGGWVQSFSVPDSTGTTSRCDINRTGSMVASVPFQRKSRVWPKTSLWRFWWTRGYSAFSNFRRSSNGRGSLLEEGSRAIVGIRRAWARRFRILLEF